jgi:DNA polymerase
VTTAVIDFETRGVVNLETAGVSRYARDRLTEVLCVGYAVGNKPARIWSAGDPLPEDLFAADEFAAHNMAFERAIWTHKLTPLHGFPPIPPLSRQRCTMAMGLAAALPGELAKLAIALDLPFKKDAEGYRLMRRMSRPRRPRKGEDPNEIYWEDGPEERKRLGVYCMNDVETERAADLRLPPLSPDEQALWELDAIINARGFFCDVPLTIAARDLSRAEQKAVDAKIAEITGGEVTSISQIDRIKAFTLQHGHAIETLTRRSIAQVLRHDPDDVVRQLLDLRLAGARASTKKFDSLIGSIDADNRLRYTLRFHGSATGRWSGRLFQPQNLKKPETKDLDAAIAAILSGDASKVRELGAPLTVAGDISRAVICAASGYRLMGGDFSSIEDRILAGIAGEGWKVENYRKFDETGDVQYDNYCILATKALKRKVTPEDEAGRAFGKVNGLAFGFGGGLGAWRKFDSSNTYSDAQITRFRDEFRNAHPATKKFWHRLERAACEAVITGQKISSEKYRLAWEMENTTLWLTLPSGRRIAYPEAKVVPGKFEGTRSLRFKDNAQGRWADVDAWYGALVENVVQATARDIMAAAMRRLEAAGYPIVLTVHDEIVCEVPNGFGSLEEFRRLMVEVPDWAADLPIAAKVWERPRYAKATTAVPDKPVALPIEPLAAVKPEKVSKSRGRKKQPKTTTPEVDSIAEVYVGYGREAQRSAYSRSKPGSAPTTPAPIELDGGGAGADVDADLALTKALATVPLADLVTEPLANGMVCCPFHADRTPSCRIYDDHFFCFGCGARGNQIDWLTKVEGLDRDEAIAQLKSGDGPTIDRAPKPKRRDKAGSIAYALKLWEAATPIAGTLAARYLSDTRGIDLAQLPADVNETLRYHPRCTFGSVNHPCLLALMRDVMTDDPVGIQRIALTRTAEKIERRALGNLGVVKLWKPNGQLVIGEGLETTLAAATRVPYEDAPLRPAWAMISTYSYAQFPAIQGVERLILLIDHDEPGINAANLCADRWSRARRTVVRLMPDEAGADFNDLIMPE